jgi:hypothetical protein
LTGSDHASPVAMATESVGHTPCLLIVTNPEPTFTYLPASSLLSMPVLKGFPVPPPVVAPDGLAAAAVPLEAVFPLAAFRAAAATAASAAAPMELVLERPTSEEEEEAAFLLRPAGEVEEAVVEAEVDRNPPLSKLLVLAAPSGNAPVSA